jgi:hypothetical protein
MEISEEVQLAVRDYHAISQMEIIGENTLRLRTLSRCVGRERFTLVTARRRQAVRQQHDAATLERGRERASMLQKLEGMLERNQSARRRAIPPSHGRNQNLTITNDSVSRSMNRGGAPRPS